LDVCTVESKGLKELIEKVISFLKDNFTELKQLMDHPDVETGVLDFSITGAMSLLSTTASLQN